MLRILLASPSLLLLLSKTACIFKLSGPALRHEPLKKLEKLLLKKLPGGKTQGQKVEK